jgi:hypothetical protein
VLAFGHHCLINWANAQSEAAPVNLPSKAKATPECLKKEVRQPDLIEIRNKAARS